jgi:hypothetical protein
MARKKKVETVGFQVNRDIQALAKDQAIDHCTKGDCLFGTL